MLPSALSSDDLVALAFDLRQSEVFDAVAEKADQVMAAPLFVLPQRSLRIERASIAMPFD